ncbi:hypothetical protein OUZ56_008627 [Daphnia magna]|uniref:Uncharacterized protein n=1 Tax=Daphnia magna TaxID=35525 RepID=A0ABR0ADK1_9CRUS|nr:hypothetical protein OUZ56_008627 [Daphnia magna]
MAPCDGITIAFARGSPQLRLVYERSRNTPPSNDVALYDERRCVLSLPLIQLRYSYRWVWEIEGCGRFTKFNMQRVFPATARSRLVEASES